MAKAVAKSKVRRQQVSMPKSAYELVAKNRQVFGRKVKRLRKEGVLPGNIYGRDIKSVAVQVALGDFEKVFAEVGETGLVGLKVDGDLYPVLIHNVQYNPVTDQPLHADFLKVNLAEKITASVPVEIAGVSPAVASEEGVLVQQMHEVEVEALPTELPEKIVVDISGLTEVDAAIKVLDLKVPGDVEIRDDPQRIVVNVAPPAKEEEIVPPAEEVPPEEGAPPAEGEAIPEGEPKEEKAGEEKASE